MTNYPGANLLIVQILTSRNTIHQVFSYSWRKDSHLHGKMCHPINMGWIQDHRRQTSQDSHHQQDAETQFAAAARSRWQELGNELRADVAEFNKQGSGAELAIEGENTYRVSNSSAGLELELKADFDNHSVSYDYKAINQRSAGVPEGGMLSMRQSRRGDVEFYSADERLTSEETRQVLLEPLLFPKQSAA
jgi:hypothetical protein